MFLAFVTVLNIVLVRVHFSTVLFQVLWWFYPHNLPLRIFFVHSLVLVFYLDFLFYLSMTIVKYICDNDRYVLISSAFYLLLPFNRVHFIQIVESCLPSCLPLELTLICSFLEVLESSINPNLNSFFEAVYNMVETLLFRNVIIISIFFRKIGMFL